MNKVRKEGECVEGQPTSIEDVRASLAAVSAAQLAAENHARKFPRSDVDAVLVLCGLPERRSAAFAELVRKARNPQREQFFLFDDDAQGSRARAALRFAARRWRERSGLTTGTAPRRRTPGAPPSSREIERCLSALVLAADGTDSSEASAMVDALNCVRREREKALRADAVPVVECPADHVESMARYLLAPTDNPESRLVAALAAKHGSAPPPYVPGVCWLASSKAGAVEGCVSQLIGAIEAAIGPDLFLGETSLAGRSDALHRVTRRLESWLQERRAEILDAAARDRDAAAKRIMRESLNRVLGLHPRFNGEQKQARILAEIDRLADTGRKRKARAAKSPASRR